MYFLLVGKRVLMVSKFDNVRNSGSRLIGEGAPR